MSLPSLFEALGAVADLPRLHSSSEGSPDGTLAAAELDCDVARCCLVLTLSRWAAQRAVLPLDGTLASALRSLPHQPDTPLPVAHELDDADEEVAEAKREECRRRAPRLDWRLSQLIPTPAWERAAARVQLSAPPHRRLNSPAERSDSVDSEDGCVAALCARLTALMDVRPVGAADVKLASTARDAVAALQCRWRDLRQREEADGEHVMHTPARSQVATLLRVHAEARVELSATSLLQTLAASHTASSSDASETAATAAMWAVEGLLGAQQAARAAATHFASEVCGQLITHHIRPLLAELLGPPASSLHFPAPPVLAVHRHVELSVDPSRTVAGVGLVAAAPIGEGELLVQEAALSFRADGDASSGVGDVCGAECTVNSAGAADAAPPRCDVPAAEEKCARAGGGEVPEPDGVRGTVCGAALELLSFLRAHPRLLSSAWGEWAANVLSHGAPATSGPAGAPQDLLDSERQRRAGAATHRAEPPTSRSRPVSPSRLLLRLRAVDEFRIDSPARPPHAPSALPTGDSIAATALFGFLRHVNHACVPNALLVSELRPRAGVNGVGGGAAADLVAALVSLRAIEEGEEIFISYVPATTALTVAHVELTESLGFACRCELCTRKAALLRGGICGECGHLVGEREGAEAGSPADSTVFSHAEGCSQRLGGTGGDAGAGRGSVAADLRRQLDSIAAGLRSGENETAGTAECAGSGAVVRDPFVAAVRRLVDLDACVAPSLLPTHFLRVRLRLEAFAYSVVARGLGSTVSAELIHLCAHTLEELEVLLPAHHPLLTGLRMYLVFSCGRHIRAVSAAEDVAQGMRHSDCCGAVREQAALMQLPFVVDPLVRRCVARCFQEHYVQLLAWRESWLSRAGEAGVLGSFLARFPVELEACGVTTAEHMEFLSCMEDGTEYT